MYDPNASVVFTRMKDGSISTLALKPSFSSALLGGLVGVRIGRAVPGPGVFVCGFAGAVLGCFFGPHDNALRNKTGTELFIRIPLYAYSPSSK